jgi:branched-subunit amino acid aminotransferase/4-amino-4-deoxychorismate lyase
MALRGLTHSGFGNLVSGVFTTARVTNGTIDGMAAHISRLEMGARLLAAEHGIPFGQDLRFALERADFERRSHLDAMARMALGVDPRGHSGHFVEFAPARRKRWETGDRPLVLTTARDPRSRVDIKRFPRTDLLRVEERATAADADGVVLMQSGDALCEGTWFHIIAAEGRRWRTPPIGQVIPGTTRERVLRGLRAAGDTVSEGGLTLAGLGGLDGLYALSALLEIAPIASVGGIEVSAADTEAHVTTLRHALHG